MVQREICLSEMKKARSMILQQWRNSVVDPAHRPSVGSTCTVINTDIIEARAHTHARTNTHTHAPARTQSPLSPIVAARPLNVLSIHFILTWFVQNVNFISNSWPTPLPTRVSQVWPLACAPKTNTLSSVFSDVKFSMVRFAVVGLNTFSEGVVLCYLFNKTFRLIPNSNVENSIQTWVYLRT